jgi:hypothetical protein
MTSRICLFVLVAGAALACPAMARAAGPGFEIMPFGAYRLSGDLKTGDVEDGTTRTGVEDGSGWGVELALYRDAESFYQVFYSRRDAGLETPDAALRGTDLRIEYFHFGGTLLFPQRGGYSTYFTLTIGLTRFEASASEYGTENRFSAALGGGFRIPFTERLSATLGVRGFSTFVSSDSDLVCISAEGQGSCLLRSSGRSYWEVEALAGLNFRF